MVKILYHQYMGNTQLKIVCLWHWSGAVSKLTREGHCMPGQVLSLVKLGEEKSYSILYGSTPPSECKAYGPSATTTIQIFHYICSKALVVVD